MNIVFLFQALCQSLAVSSASEAVELCVCCHQLSDPATWHVTPADLTRLTSWWRQRMAGTVDTCLDDRLYLDIVARSVTYISLSLSLSV